MISAEELVIQYVSEYPGIRAINLLVKLIEAKCTEQQHLKEINFTTVIESLHENGELVCLVYILPGSEDRIRRMYFPKETVLVKPDEI